MSRRYGRNQRRQHRERIAELEATCVRLDQARVMADGLSKYMSGQVEQMRQVLEVAERVLGPDHPAFGVRNTVGRRPSDGSRMKHAPMAPIDFNVAMTAMPVDLYERWSYIDIMTTKQQRDEWRQQINFRVSYAGKEWGYAITQEAFRSMPAGAMQRRVAEELSHLIVQDMRMPTERRNAASRFFSSALPAPSQDRET